ncbi:murein biosynthesis integral membrane protein MurJ [Alsobacter sp. SYSU M60028]|uniref:Probable lipid II flippase MurJ n=1 Tax=Alsobacter ponti TaxID=2962936 RepID=A0ABT1LC08_9HYPH|nr:murein biosynthesis integral membrane protein MurJ [Alsobacter ponti]MCP8938606.1 murein biosynthesis integral membrane protein MurJ [Alsobacter ponti]
MGPSLLARSALVVGACAALSRVLGFARDVLLAAVLGAGPAADAFVVAFRLPGLFRRVLGEGALNGGLVPVENRLRREEGDERARRFAGEALAGVGLAMLGVVALAELAAPLLVLALAAGYADDPTRFGLAVDYTRLMLPLVGASMLTATAGALLNARGRVLAAALAPVAVNLVLVAVLLALRASDAAPERLGLWLAAATTLAGIVHLAALAAAIRTMPDRPLWSRPRWSPELRRALAIGAPGLLTMAAGQLAIVVATQIASRTDAAVARLYYADRLYQLPLGFVAAGAGVVLLPEMVRLWASGGGAAVAGAVNRSLAWTLLLVLPAAVALATLAQPIVSVLFERGEFGREDAVATAQALAALAPGLPLAAVVRVLAQPFLARESVRAPLAAALAGVAATAAAATALAPAWDVAGIAAGVTVGAAVHAALLAAAAWSAGWLRPDRATASRVLRMAACSVLMGAAVAAAAAGAAPALSPDGGSMGRVAALLALCAGGAALYGALALASGAASLRDLRGES